jgi:hypothetical protein
MKRLLLILATLALATSAMAMIGQTPDQVIADAQREKAARVFTVQFRGRSLLQVTYQSSFIHHLFGTNGREIALYYYAGSRFSATDINNLQRRYQTGWRGPETRNGVTIWKSDNGLQMMVSRQPNHDYLTIFDMSRIQEIVSGSSNGTVLPDTTETNVYPPATDTAEYPPQQQPYVAPPTPAPVPQSTPNIASDDKDCLIKAAEKVTELRHGGYWAIIVRFDQTKDGQKLEWGGHAVVVFQLKAGQTLFYWDKDLGSISLGTTSRELEAIAPALNGLYHPLTGSHFGVQGVEWIDS